MNKYYKNQECKILHELNKNELVIEILTKEVDKWDYDGEYYAKPSYIKIVVDKKYITNHLISEDSIYKDLMKYKEEMTKELNNEMKKIYEKIANKKIEAGHILKEVEEKKQLMLKEHAEIKNLENIITNIKESRYVAIGLCNHPLELEEINKNAKRTLEVEIRYNIETNETEIKALVDAGHATKTKGILFKDKYEVINYYKKVLRQSINHQKQISNFRLGDIIKGLELIGYKGILYCIVQNIFKDRELEDLEKSLEKNKHDRAELESKIQKLTMTEGSGIII